MMNILEDKLRHASSGVLLGCVKVFVNFTKHDDQLLRQVFERVRPMLVTHFLVGNASNNYEVSYTILANMVALVKCGA